MAVAPAMNVEMWNNPANQRNIQQLISDDITVFQPSYGEQACGEIGIGRMPEGNIRGATEGVSWGKAVRIIEINR